jgi:UDP-N-acetylmuramoyl-tripeptide--D-alanyl-D-alanine ligase
VIPLSLGEMAALLGGTLHDAPDPAVRVTGSVEFDSRQVGPGGLFVALPGQRHDGHDHAAAAVAAGAVGVLAARPVGVPAVLVPDVLAALGELARVVLRRLPALTVVGVTGSSGKTSTKDLLAQLLARLGPTVAPPGSYNNEIGHPYTALKATGSTRYLVLEISARGLGHISRLCQIAPPRIGVVLNVGSAHLGEFGSREAVAQAKGELVEALPTAAEGGVAVLNADDPLVVAMAGRTPARAVWFGSRAWADVRATGCATDGRGRPGYLLRAGGERAAVQLRCYGEHQVPNSLAAAAVAIELGMPVAAVAEALSAAEPQSRWRMEVTERADGVTVINDAYNANPESMQAALRALAAIASRRPAGRGWAVLGQMAELGADSDREHELLGRLAARQRARLVVVGAEAAAIRAGALAEGAAARDAVPVPDWHAAVRLLHEELAAPDVVLVKASRAVGLERVALALLAGQPTGGARA